MSRGVLARKLLRCSAFEEFMLDQDAPEHPCVICLRLELEGELDGPRLNRALVTVAQRHPLLRAKLESRWGKLWWQIQPDVAAELQVHTCPAPAWPTARYFDLMHTVGLQADLFPAESSQPNILFLQIHHALADGLGCLQVVEDLLAEYASPSDRSTQSSSIDTSSIDIVQRNRFGLNVIRILRLIPQQCIGLAGVRQFLMRRPVPLNCGPNDHTESARLTALKHQLTREQSELLKQSAKQYGATLNDYLACLVFEACDALRRDQAAYNQTEWLRMMVPISLRNAQSQPSACNVVSCVFLDRTGQQIAHRRELLRSIHDEMELIKRNRLGFVFIFSLWLRKVCRFRSRRSSLVAAKPRQCQTSMVFSNMGRIFETSRLPITPEGQVQAGQLRLAGLQVLAPVAPLMHAAITTFHYAGRITLSLRYDGRAIGHAHAARLLERIAQRIDFSVSEMSQA